LADRVGYAIKAKQIGLARQAVQETLARIGKSGQGR
jgi:hypothetical protein